MGQAWQPPGPRLSWRASAPQRDRRGCPATGQLVSLLVPHCNKEVFQVFLDTVAAEVPEEQGKTVHLVLDNASWHKSTSLDWHHLQPVHLPPYSPDFNPIERLSQHFKGQYLAGFITAKGEELEDKILASLRTLLDEPETIRSICSVPRLNRQ